MFKDIGNSIKAATVFILILGFLKHLIYYMNFHVPIKFFFGLSDLWLFLSDDFIYTAPLAFFWLAFSSDFKDLTDENIEWTAEEKKQAKREKLFAFITTVLIIVIIGATYYFFRTEEYFKRVLLKLAFVYASIFLILFFLRKDKRRFFQLGRIFYYSFGFGILTFFLAYRTGLQIRDVNHSLYKGTIIKTADSTYVSNDSSYFIGKTESFLFIYNSKDTTTDIIPSDLVKEIVIKTKH